MNDDQQRFVTATDYFDQGVRAIAPDQWGNPTPCTEWDVRALVNHVVGELRWVAPLLAGQTVAEVGDRFDSDLIGSDPKAAWAAARAEARREFERPAALDAVVHLSYGDDLGRSYCHQLTLDALIHGWDLASGVAGDTTMPEELVDWALKYCTPIQAVFAASGLYGRPQQTGPGANEQTVLLAMVGRTG